MGVATECGCKEVYRFIPTFCSFKKYINTHIYEQQRASHGSYMKAVHNILYMKKHTQTYASYPEMEISCMTSRSVVYISK